MALTRPDAATAPGCLPLASPAPYAPRALLVGGWVLTWRHMVAAMVVDCARHRPDDLARTRLSRRRMKIQFSPTAEIGFSFPDRGGCLARDWACSNEWPILAGPVCLAWMDILSPQFWPCLIPSSRCLAGMRCGRRRCRRVASPPPLFVAARWPAFWSLVLQPWARCFWAVWRSRHNANLCSSQGPL